MKELASGVFVVEEFLSDEMCAHFIAEIDRTASPSTVVGHAASHYREGGRTSSSAHFYSGDAAIKKVEARMAELACVPMACGESLQGQRYDAGQEFREHFDWFGGSGASHIGDLGNRSHTVIVYLNDGFEGGQTEFPRLGLSIQPKRGMAVVWENLDASGEGRMDMLHSGKPVLSGKKYILTQWFRQKAIFHSAADLPRCTARGFDVMPVPDRIFGRVIEAYRQLAGSAARENDWGVLDGSRGYAADLMSLDRVPEVRDFLLRELLPIHSDWSGAGLVPAVCYGIRSYRPGASLKLHRDRVETHHISSIMVVDADDASWPLDIQDHSGCWHKVQADPGHMILYESAVCEHGRTEEFSGGFFRNLFTHYSLKDWVCR